MSLISGTRSGLLSGVRTGLNPSMGGYTFTTDGPANVKVPLSSADWTALSLPAPLYQWNCQEASGNLASNIGSLTLTATGSNFVYQQSVAGWTRKFVGVSAETANARWGTTDASLDAALGQSVAWLLYASVQAASTSTRVFFMASAAPVNQLRVNTGTAYQHLHNNLSTNAGTAPDLTVVKPMIWYRNATTNASGLIMPGDHTTGTHEEAAYTGGTIKSLGSSGFTTAIFRCSLLSVWMGANAETVAVPGTLTTLGW